MISMMFDFVRVADYGERVRSAEPSFLFFLLFCFFLVRNRLLFISLVLIRVVLSLLVVLSHLEARVIRNFCPWHYPYRVDKSAHCLSVLPVPPPLFGDHEVISSVCLKEGRYRGSLLWLSAPLRLSIAKKSDSRHLR